MHPVLFQFGGVTIYTYGVLAAVGFLLGLWWAYRQAPRAGLDPRVIWNLGVYGILIALLSSKIWYILSMWDYFIANPRDIFSLGTFQSAGTFYGGVVGGIVWVIFYTRLHKLPVLSVFDVCAAPVALGHSIGRVGCFVAGCCYGKPTSLPWAVTFTNPIASRISGTPLNISLHPTQLYEAGAEFLNFLLLVWLGTRQRFSGQLIGAYFILYGLERGSIEFLRDDPGRTLMFHDSVSLMQLVSVGLIVTGALLWWRGLRGEAPIPRQPAMGAAR
ncbi:MAG TPA: prolipoprotein diacylglyceryl transferase [Candidatus Acidoferrales bacterium]|jgi:phosphatidylglycerol:prolipoprotein diacylglycerol transferase|nr:prolipoprotein diacylglyceryl transferase [Candidatus Acidoferrales bacterium]